MPSLLNRYCARWNPLRVEEHDYIVRIEQNIFYYYLLLLSYCCSYTAMRVRAAGMDAGGCGMI